MSIVYRVHRKTMLGWSPESGGWFEVGQTAETSSDAMAKTAAFAYAGKLIEVGAEVKVIRTETSQVWPQSEYRTREIPVARGLEWHEGEHPWDTHDGYPRHQHSINGVLTIAPNGPKLHFAWDKFEQVNFGG